MRLIDADALGDKVADLYSEGEEATEGDKVVNDVIDLIDNAPTIKPKVVVIEPDIIEKLADSVVDVISKIDWDKAIEAYKERPQGKWLEDGGNIACSHCHTIWLYRRTDYCPHCGAEMTKEAENE